MGALVLLAGCKSEAPPAPVTPQPASAAAPASPSPREEFLAQARAIREGSNMYLGLAPMRQLQSQLGTASLGLSQRYQATMLLARMEVREGKVAEGIAHIEEAGKLLQEMIPRLASDPRDVISEYHAARAIAYLRSAEQTNCLASHSADSCILPFRGSGIHHVPEPAQEALRSWQEVLKQKPDDLGARWLLNVTAMILGRHPDAVPAEFRVDFGKHQSRVKHLPEMIDVAPALGLARLSLAGGMMIEDFDGDGRLDVLTSTSDPEGPLSYMRSRGDGTFEDLSAASGLDQQLGGLNAVALDFDGDADSDVMVLRGGWQADDGQVRLSLLRNDGTGRFEDVTYPMGLAAIRRPTQVAAWADYDDDGDLDVFIGSEVKMGPDRQPQPFPSRLYRNDGDRFAEIAAEAGVLNGLQAKGAAAGDYDNDGDMDIYVSNIGPNRLYRNDGGMKFTDVAAQAGVLEPIGRSFVPWFFDFDDDGWLDIWVPGYDAQTADLAADLLGLPMKCKLPSLYRNRGDGTFEDVAARAGLAHAYLPMGANFGDLDGDGWLDIYLGTGDPEFSSLMPNVMLWNDGGKRFLDVTAQTRLGHLQKGHGVAFADIDDDGDQDIAHQLGGFVLGDRFHDALFLNPGPASGARPRFLYLKLRGAGGNAQAIGARVEVEVETPRGTRVLHRAAGSVSSFGGSPLSRLEIGLGDATKIRQLRIWWPKSRVTQVFEDVALDSCVKVVEGQDSLEPVALSPISLAPAR